MNTELLHKYIAGYASEEERREVMKWIQESPENLCEYKVQRRIFDISVWRADEAYGAGRRKSYILKPVFRWIAGVAAVLIVGISTALLWFADSHDDRQAMLQSVYVPAGQRAELTLSDGTRVWLNSRTTLSFPGTFEDDIRNVKLDGEGYFDVARNPEQPFIVETSKYDVRVLGTEFNVTAYASDSIWETSLLKGKVEVMAGKTRVEMKPNTKMSLHGNRLTTNRIEEMDYYRWREGLICFNNISLKDMIEKLKLYYGVDIVVNNQDILHNHYTGKFRTSDGIEHVLRVLKLSNKFTYTKDDEKNLIIIN